VAVATSFKQAVEQLLETGSNNGGDFAPASVTWPC